jgi:two-component sensor histidine kinase
VIAVATLVATVQLLFVTPDEWSLPVAWEHVVASLAFVAFSGVMIAIIGAFQSTLRQLAEANRRLAAADQEKGLLLRELTHRVQNHFSALAAAVRIQRRGTTDRAAQDALLAMEARVMALARINARLAYRGGSASIDCKEMIEALIEDMQAANSDRRIAIRLEVEDGHRLPIQQAAPIGLALCEIVTNALKHAFPDGRSGSMAVRFRGQGQLFELEVVDDGVGERQGGEAAGARVGSGSFLLDAFSRQLGGTFRKEPVRPSGTRCVVTFPRAPIEDSSEGEPGTSS